MSSTNSTIIETSPYGYTPDRSVCLAFVILFALSLIAHIVQASIFLRKVGWWLFATACFCGVGETLGWAGRLWSSYNVLNSDAFLIQVVCLIISPTPLLAAVFIVSSRVIARLDPCYSRLSPRMYSRIFLTFDIVSLFIQAAGGGLTDSSNPSTATMGGHIMLAGIVCSLMSITIFSICIGEFFYRYLTDKPLPKHHAGSVETLNARVRHPMILRLRLMIAGMLLMTGLLLSRGIYRTIELSHGFNSKLMEEQITFDILDGGMVVLAMYTLNVLHPGFLLRPDDEGDSDAIALGKPEGYVVRHQRRPSTQELLQSGQPAISSPSPSIPA